MSFGKLPFRNLFRRIVTASISGLLFIGPSAGILPVSAYIRSDTAEKVKVDVAKRTGEKVVVTMKTGPKMKGIVSNVLDESFDLLDAKTRQPTTIPYRDVEKVRKQGWSTAAKVALGVAIGVGVVTAVVFGGLAKDPFEGGFCPLGC